MILIQINCTRFSNKLRFYEVNQLKWHENESKLWFYEVNQLKWHENELK